MFFDLSQRLRKASVDKVNENYYRKTMDRISTCYARRASAGHEAPPRIASEALLGERKEIVIVHNGREYRLRQTQNGKLILTA
jgi:hemin uptake protein HemP